MTAPTRDLLPVDAHLDAIRQAVQDNLPVIVKAEPGAGKTTRIPPALLTAVGRKIIVLEPRRLAARLSAQRISDELGEACGKTTGYQIRQESCHGHETRILFVTEGVFLRMLVDDPSLKDIDAVILDEFHERHLQTDIALAACRQLRSARRPDLRLLIMSATLDTGRLESWFGASRVFDVPGRTFAVKCSFMPPGETEQVQDAVRRAVMTLLDHPECPGDILVFLTGMREINLCAERLADIARSRGLDVLPLYADLSPQAQSRVFVAGRRKVVLATNVAETSLTIPGVTGVIDTGRARIAGYAPWSGISTLDVRRVSKASVIQRSGRAGRVRTGLAVRLFSETDYHARPDFTPPEIQRLELAPFYLEVLKFARAMGGRPASLAEALPWYETPDNEHAASAARLLRILGAIDAENQLTRLGERIAGWPLHPRLACIVATGQDHGLAPHALLAACMISEGMLLKTREVPPAHVDCDVAFQLEILIRISAGDLRSLPASVSSQVDRARSSRILELYRQVARMTGISPKPPTHMPDNLKLGSLLITGFPDRVAKRRTMPVTAGRKPRVQYAFCQGRGGILAPGSVVHDQDLVIVIDATEIQNQNADTGTMIHVAAAVSESDLKEAPGGLYSIRTEQTWNDPAGRTDISERVYYGNLIIRERRVQAQASGPESSSNLLTEKLRAAWPKPFDDDSDLETYHARLDLLDPESRTSFPIFKGEMLDLLIAAIADGKRSFEEIRQQPLSSWIVEQLTWDQIQQLKTQAPFELHLKNGRRFRVHYSASRGPVIQGYIQDFYGLAETPQIGPGRLPVLCELQGPNKRPLQVTSDLPGFWARTYQEMRNELSRNYPKHHWPSDPATAPAVLHKRQLGK